MEKYEQKLPPAPVLLKIIIVQQKSLLSRICLKSARMNFSLEFKRTKHKIELPKINFKNWELVHFWIPHIWETVKATTNLLIHFRLEFQFQKLHTNNDIKYKNFSYIMVRTC